MKLLLASAVAAVSILATSTEANAATCQQLAEWIVSFRQEISTWETTENYGVAAGYINLMRSSQIDSYRSNLREYYARCAYYTPLPAAQPSSPPPFNNLISDTGKLKLQRNGYNLSYFFIGGSSQIKGYVNVFSSTDSKIVGSFQDTNGFGCRGNVTFQRVRAGRWISTWDLEPWKKGDKCDGATTRTMLSEKQ